MYKYIFIYTFIINYLMYWLDTATYYFIQCFKVNYPADRTNRVLLVIKYKKKMWLKFVIILIITTKHKHQVLDYITLIYFTFFLINFLILITRIKVKNTRLCTKDDLMHY